MPLSKKDFELLAETVSNLPRVEVTGPEVRAVEFNTLVKELSDMCASQNGRFDRERFARACHTENYRAPRNITRY